MEPFITAVYEKNEEMIDIFNSHKQFEASARGYGVIENGKILNKATSPLEEAFRIDISHILGRVLNSYSGLLEPAFEIANAMGAVQSAADIHGQLADNLMSISYRELHASLDKLVSYACCNHGISTQLQRLSAMHLSAKITAVTNGAGDDGAGASCAGGATGGFNCSADNDAGANRGAISKARMDTGMNRAGAAPTIWNNVTM